MTIEFSRIRFIMTEPSHPGNVGSAARAIKTMGFSDLVLVAPKSADITTQPEAISLASGASDVLENTPILTTLDQALAPITLAFAMTARERDLGPPSCDIRQAAEMGRAHLLEHPHARIAIVVGTERSGLTNEQIGLCHRLCHIPANPEYSSLNVSQALQLAAWELRYALLQTDLTAPAPAVDAGSGRRPASSESIVALMIHWQEALEAVEFLNPAHPKKLMPRMRHMFTRSNLSQDEVDMMRGVCTAMIQTAKTGTRNPPNPS